MPNTFVEEYRKELSATGYPFSSYVPLLTDTGYALALGTLEDASIYCEDASRIPVFTSIEKAEQEVTFRVGDYAGVFNLKALPEVLSLYSPSGVFGGIVILSQTKTRAIGGWKDGTHTIVKPPAFCPRCIELVPPVGVQRIVTDNGEILSGEVVISGGFGTTLQLLVSPSGVEYIEVNFVGDPTYTASERTVPIQQVICSDTFGTEITLTGDESKNVAIVASNPFEGNLFEDTLRVEGYDSIVRVSLGGK